MATVVQRDDLFDRAARVELIDEETGEGLSISDLRITFDIDKTSQSNPNTARISIYNLNPTSRGFSERPNLKIQLFVGYLGIGQKIQNLGLLFSGNVTRYVTEKSGTDYITTFETGDGEKAVNESNFNKTYSLPKVPNVYDIMKEMAKNVGIVVNDENIKLRLNKKFENGITFSGPIKKHMDQLAALSKTEWSVQSGELQVNPVDGGSVSDIVIISESTGLIGIPVKRQIDLGKRTVGEVALDIPKQKKTTQKVRKKKTKEQTKFNGIEFTALINTLIRPTGIVQVISNLDDATAVNGVFVVKKAEYSGDTREGDWMVKCECLEVTDQPTLDNVRRVIAFG